MKLSEIIEHKCTKCKYSWISRLNYSPKVCPRCKSYKWKEEKEVKDESG